MGKPKMTFNNLNTVDSKHFSRLTVLTLPGWWLSSSSTPTLQINHQIKYMYTYVQGITVVSTLSKIMYLGQAAF